MQLDDVMDQLGDALDAIDGLRVHREPVDQVAPPSAVVTLPETIDLEAAYRRGLAIMDFEVVVMVGMVSERAMVQHLSTFVSPGVSSVKAAIDGGAYSACDSATVRSVKFEPFRVGSVDYMAAVFTVHVAGSGTT